MLSSLSASLFILPVHVQNVSAKYENPISSTLFEMLAVVYSSVSVRQNLSYECGVTLSDNIVYENSIHYCGVGILCR